MTWAGYQVRLSITQRLEFDSKLHVFRYARTFISFQDAIAFQNPGTFVITDLTSVYCSRAYSPLSLPKPDSLKPPNGAPGLAG